MAEVTCTHVWVFDLFPHCSTCLFSVPVLYCFYYCGSGGHLRTWNENPSSIVLFTQDCSVSLEYFVSLYEVLNFIFTYSYDEQDGDLIGIAWNL